jgi:hypothetical protein
VDEDELRPSPGLLPEAIDDRRCQDEADGNHKEDLKDTELKEQVQTSQDEGDPIQDLISNSLNNEEQEVQNTRDKECADNYDSALEGHQDPFDDNEALQDHEDVREDPSDEHEDGQEDPLASFSSFNIFSFLEEKEETPDVDNDIGNEKEITKIRNNGGKGKQSKSEKNMRKKGNIKKRSKNVKVSTKNISTVTKRTRLKTLTTVLKDATIVSKPIFPILNFVAGQMLRMKLKQIPQQKKH